AAVRLADIDAAETELGDPRPERLRDRALPLPVAREGRDVFLPEGMGHVEDGALLLTQGEVHLSSHPRRGSELNARYIPTVAGVLQAGPRCFLWRPGRRPHERGRDLRERHACAGPG